MKGSTYKRCKCPAQYDAKGNRKNCRKDHGTWYYVADVGRGADGKRKQVRKGGFRTSDDAEEALNKLLAKVGEGTYSYDEGMKLSVWLDQWIELKEREGRRVTTLRSYRHHIRDYIKPHMGHIRLRDLRASHVDRMVTAINDGKLSKTTVRRVHATLSSALQTAAKKDLIAFNVARKATLRRPPIPRSSRGPVRSWAPSSTRSAATGSAACSR
ncbi:Arm DNA-binding domain-containing protein [Streptomyces sp. ARC32]